jgi:hypothetical protein
MDMRGTAPAFGPGGRTGKTGPSGSLAAALTLLALVACATVPAFPSGPPSGLPLLGEEGLYRFAVGASFAVATRDNPSTGYEPLYTIYPYPQKIDLSPSKVSELVEHKASDILALEREIYGSDPDPRLVGAGRDLWYLFKAAAPGRVRLLVFFRKWDGTFSMDGGRLYDIEILP